MIFFLDENFPKSAGTFLESKGHEVIDIRLTEDIGLDDNSIFSLAQKHSAIFLTTDKDFFHTIPLKFENHNGIIVIALSLPNRKNILEKLIWSYENINLEKLSNRVILLRDNNYLIKDSDKNK